MIAAYRVNNEAHERGALLLGWQQFLRVLYLLDHSDLFIHVKSCDVVMKLSWIFTSYKYADFGSYRR